MQVLINIFLSTLITTISLHISWIPFIIVTKCGKDDIIAYDGYMS